MELFTDSVSIDRLEQVLLQGESLIAQIRARQAEALARLRHTEVVEHDGSRTMVDWTAARLDVTHDTARDLLTLARASAERPELLEPLTAGEMTADRCVATVKLAATGATDDVLEHSKGFDLNGVRRLSARHRRMTRHDERDVFLEQFVAIQPTLDHSAARFWGQLPGFEARIFEKALRQRADQFNELPGPKMQQPMRMANALVSIAQDSLSDPDTPPGTASGGADPLVTVFVDGNLAAQTSGQAGAGVEFGPKIGPATLERILCEGAVQLIVKTDTGLVASHATRAIPPAVRRYVTWRDGQCTIDGCTSHNRLQPHHITERSNGGNHDVSNLTTLCWYHHHTIIHGAGYTIDPESPPQRRRLRPPTGVDPPPLSAT